ncbi:hypothetical protein [Flaviaesturariibacter amylovorans]|uniref:Porin n=1 Tax=Flaviaesturariibacter amylovorans TaxID=1084520 RepID=A0ABP8HLV0_9BACT
MKPLLIFALAVGASVPAFAQIDPVLLRRPEQDSGGARLNMDAVYSRPFSQFGKLPVALGGYVEANYQYVGQDGVSDRHQFQFRRLTLFVSSSISKRIRFLSEIEFEDGAKEISVEFASVDFEFNPLFNLRGGIVLNPIGAFNQNHDGPKWEFVDRPLSATRMLPATFSNVGFGVYGKKYAGDWVYGYEAYLTNGFNERIVDNTEGRTYLPATKEDPDRFEENFSGSMLFTGKTALRHRKVGELGVSYMSGAYNKFEVDGLKIDRKRTVSVWAVDFNSTLRSGTALTGEWAWVKVDLPADYTEQFGRKQQGGFLDIVQPVWKRSMFGFDNAVLNAALRIEYVDWNRGRFGASGSMISDHLFSLVPALSWRPSAQTVLRFNYRYQWQRDLFGNPPSRLAAFQFGFSSYF